MVTTSVIGKRKQDGRRKETSGRTFGEEFDLMAIKEVRNAIAETRGKS